MPNTPVLVVDLRCLQDVNYRERGIGRHALSLLRHARACSPFAADHPIVGLADPALPALAPDVAALVDRVQHDGYLPDTGGCRFVAPSPMTHAPGLFARLATRPDCLSAAAVFDFIPLDEPSRYLPTPAARIDYRARFAALSWFDLLLPISHSVGERLRDTLLLSPRDLVVTGVGFEAVFEQTGAGMAGRHVITIGGPDPRKNVELAVRAHAGCIAVGDLGIKLIVTGNYGEDEIHALTRLHVECGGRPGHLQFPGHVDEAQLPQLYRRALCVVTPSRNEGFSLPVVEAMAAGVPSFASDIPPHRELVTNPALRFGVDDHGALTRLLGQAVHPGWREGVVASQAAIWPAFRAEAVARRFWSALDARALPAPSVLRGRRPRLAFVTPLPPDRSGVADYSAATVAELARRVDLTVFTPTAAPEPLPGAGIARLSDLPGLLGEFDRVVNVMGNSDFHAPIFDAQLRHGGACICHDNRLLSFYVVCLGRPHLLRTASAELGRVVENPEADGWQHNEATLEATFLGELAASAQPLLLHSRPAASLVRERFGMAPAYLPFAVLRSWTETELSDASRAAARRRLGVPEGDILIVSFGYVADNKAPQECIWALDLLRWWKLPVRLVFAGANMDGIDYPIGLRDALGLQDRVTFLGSFTTEAVWRDYYLAADYAVQLRAYGGGLSGALQDAISAGLPTVATADMADAMDAPPFVRRTPDRIASVLVAEALADMIEAGAHRIRNTPARRAFLAEHNQGVYSERLCEALGLSVTRRP